MTKKQAKQWACAWIAADLQSHDNLFSGNHEDEKLIREAYEEVVEEMIRRAGPYYKDARGPKMKGW